MPQLAPYIKIGEVLGESPRQVYPGTPFWMLKVNNSNVLLKDEDSPYVNQIPSAALRDDYIDYLLGNKIEVVNDGDHEGYPDSFAREEYPLVLVIKLKRYPLTITANNRSKDADETITFNGTEYTATGLQPGDTITSVTITSSGAAAGNPPGTYPIVPSDAIINPSSSQNRYDITYVNGTLTVTYCPWEDGEAINVRYTNTYSEQTNPFNAVTSSPKVNVRSWGVGVSELDSNEQSNSVGDPFARGSDGVASADVEVKKTSATNIRITATLQDLGKPWENLIDAQTQVKNIGCENFLLGGLSTFSWVANWFGGFPIGLVMSFTITVRHHDA